jgi:glutamate-ammonia-ligase adenylyltransferase
MTDSNRDDLQLTIEALPALLRGSVATWFERLAERHPERCFPDGSLTPLVRLVAVSEFAGGLLLRDWQWFVDNYEQLQSCPDGADLDDFVEDVGGSEETVDVIKQRIRRYRHRRMLHILWREVTGDANLDETLGALSDLADRLLDAATRTAQRLVLERHGYVRDADGNVMPIVILGMGKLGGRELNFSSDIDLIFLYPEGRDSDGRKPLSPQEYFTRISRHIIALIDERTVDGFAFRIDTRLRPFGDSGPPVVNFTALESYLLQHGRDWERYAYVKARIVGPQPDDTIAEDLNGNLVEPFVYRRYIDYGVFESLREMHAMIAAEVRRRELSANVKLGPGGIREIEFIVQSLQLVRGGAEPELRSQELQSTLVKLVGGRGLSREAAIELLRAYEFLRRLENFIQAIRDQQTHDLPQDALDQARLCVAMNCWDWEALVAELDEHRGNVSRQFGEVALRGQKADDTGSGNAEFAELFDNSADAVSWRTYLDALGLPHAQELGKRLARFAGLRAARQLDTTARRRMHRFLPRLIELVVASIHPPITLDRTLAVIERVLRRSAYLSLLNENEAALQRFVDLCSRSVYVAEQIARFPVLLDELLDVRVQGGLVTKEVLQSGLHERLARHPDADAEERTAILVRFQRASMFHIAVADFSGALPIMKVSDGLTWLAETVLDFMLDIAWNDLAAKHGVPTYDVDGEIREAGFGVIGYGKLGGIELSYGSDLDLVFLHDSTGDKQVTNGDKPLDNPVFFQRLVRRFVHLLTAQTGSGELYEIDTRLRPEGRKGVLVTSTEAFERYQEDHAWTWEHQALLRARAVAGHGKVGEEFERVRRDTLMHRVKHDTLRDDVISMRQRMRKELDRSNRQRFDLKHGKGGIGDIEFLVQYLVLDRARDEPDVIYYSDNIRQLDALADGGCLDAELVQRLQDAYRAYRRRLHHLVLDEQKPIVANEEFIEEREIVNSAWETHLGV